MTRLLVLLTVLLTVLAGCGSGDQTDEAAAAAAVDSGQTVGGKRGDRAPDFDLERIDGGRLRLSDLRGKAVLVDFWDTWCPPCRRALPHLQELSVEYADDLAVVGVAMGRNGRAAVAKYVRDAGLTFPTVMVDERFATTQAYGGVQYLPTTFLIDAEGVVREVWTGYNPKSAYESAIRQVIGA